MRKVSVFPGRVIFDHLAKTGGMAVTAWLRNVLGSGVITDDVTEDHRSLIRRYGGVYSILSAHTYFQGEGLDPRYQYFTALRDPIDRVISVLHYAENTVPETKEFIDDKKAASTFLQSEGQIVPDQIFASISNYYVNHFSGIDVDPKIETAGDLRFDAALKSLKAFDVVGIYEQLPQFLDDVADLIGLPHPGSIARVNQTNKRPAVEEISEALKVRITELNQLDIQFYEQIKAWKAACPSPPHKGDPHAPALAWNKYEPLTNRVLITQDLVLINIMLREGYDIPHGHLMTFDVDFRLTRDISELELGLNILDEAKCWAFGINSTLLKQVHSRVSSGTYRATYHLIADLPAGEYSVGVAFGERLPSKGLELAWHDNLCEFAVFHPSDRAGIGYANLPSAITLTPVNIGVPEVVVREPCGHLLLKTPLEKMRPNEEVALEVEIFNNSAHDWRGSQFFSINLSYRWFDIERNLVVADGKRTALPVDGVKAGKLVQATMEAIAPPAPGTYNLCLSIVQENVCWFHEVGSGFMATNKEVVVTG